MRRAGFPRDVAAHGIYTLSALAIALAQGQLVAREGEHPQVPELRRALDAAGPDRYPELRAVFGDGAGVFDDASFDEAIRVFLDGLAARLPRLPAADR
jgi:hypothetical protein